MRSKTIWDRQGKAYEYVDGELVWCRPDLQGEHVTTHYTIMPDLPEFVSPIDGKVVRGRKQFREHCKRHNVIPTADLQGMPLKTIDPQPSSREHREGTKRAIAEIINSKY